MIFLFCTARFVEAQLLDPTSEDRESGMNLQVGLMMELNTQTPSSLTWSASFLNSSPMAYRYVKLMKSQASQVEGEDDEFHLKSYHFLSNFR